MKYLKKHHIFLLLIVSIFVSLCAKEQVKTITHQSQILKCEKKLNIYIPKRGRKNQKEFPVLYILHGAYGSYNDWVEKTDVIKLARKYQMILVFPDGNPFSWYIDSPVQPESNYESYLIKELIPYIDENYPTMKKKGGRAIMGLSMGGHGAMTLAAKYPKLFQSASSLSGILKISDHPNKKIAHGTFGKYTDHFETWHKNSAWELASAFQKNQVDLLFDCGTDDRRTGAIFDNRKFHQRLLSLKIPHIWREHSGTHSWSYWSKHLEEHLIFHRSSMNQKYNHHYYFRHMNDFQKENANLTLNPSEKPIICLAGSSSMEGFPIRLLPREYNIIKRGISGDDIGTKKFGLGRRLEECIFDFNPAELFIFIGRNDLAFWLKYEKKLPLDNKIKQVLTEYERIIKEVKQRSPQTRITIITCPGTAGKYEALGKPVVRYNQELKKLAQKQKLKVIDLFSMISSPEGILKKEYSRDGLHITKKGYHLLAGKITDIVNEK